MNSTHLLTVSLCLFLSATNAQVGERRKESWLTAPTGVILILYGELISFLLSEGILFGLGFASAIPNLCSLVYS